MDKEVHFSLLNHCTSKVDSSFLKAKNIKTAAVPFEFQIPNRLNQSYEGKYSGYFWGLEAKLNIAWSSDIRARTIIEIV